MVGLSRRGGEAAGPSRCGSTCSTRDTRTKLGALTEVTHVFYTAYQDRPTWAELVPPNLAMLVNVVDAIEPVARRLSHISLMQGYKVYGAHLGPFKTPARETDPDHMPPEFNVDQQAFLERRQQGAAWTWSAIRPSVVCGFALGNPMNLAMVIAVYGAISKELGVPLRFPGGPAPTTSLLEMTDAEMLAKATVWAATEPVAANQAFNINNGDLFRWEEMWPKIAALLRIPTAPAAHAHSTTVMADKGPSGTEMTQARPRADSYSEVSSWAFGDSVFSWDYDMFADGSKARRHGFHDYVETEQMFLDTFDNMRARSIIPPR